MRDATRLDVAVLVFARAPLAGRVKTRLEPRLGVAAATRLHLRLMRQALRTAMAARCGPVELHLSAPHRLFRNMKPQRGADLGERMRRALQAALRRHRAAILIGSDCPALHPRDLRRAARLLAGNCDVVLGPAEDGGYVLIGARRLPAALFDGIEWGSDRVYAQTVRGLRAAGTPWKPLRMLWDVDRPADLDRLRALRFPSAPRQCARR